MTLTGSQHMRDDISRTIARRRKPERVAYQPGMYDRLLTPHEWQSPAKLLGITLEPDHAELLIIEHTRAGQHQAHHVACPAHPLELELELMDGSRVFVTVEFAPPIAALTEIAHTPADMFIDLREAAELLSFSGLEEPDDGCED